MGIDPGLQRTGYGCVSIDGPGEPVLIEAGVIRLKSATPVVERLLELHRDFGEILGRMQPDRVVVEKLYAHYKHPTTAIVMGHARGVILLAAQQAGAKVEELAATEIKKAITGFGHASKRQVQLAVQAQCRLDQPPTPVDVSDAIAIALCAARRVSRGFSG
ncbi:MAG TPA: crossover junction endodeoxyribonuclease RuvC [Phycisphaeraceae bacterium]|nr:crossover junction endodeoxyribonuclease RuvC [Phycisphaeraceae bacterium]